MILLHFRIDSSIISNGLKRILGDLCDLCGCVIYVFMNLCIYVFMNLCDYVILQISRIIMSEFDHISFNSFVFFPLLEFSRLNLARLWSFWTGYI